MTAILRVVLIAVIAVVTSSEVAAAQAAPPEDLLVRVDVLQQRVTELESRVRELETLLRAAAASREGVPTPQEWRRLENWRRLRPGMSMREVRMLLGEPGRVEVVAYTSWYYGDVTHGGHVFFEDGRVEGWSEPTR